MSPLTLIVIVFALMVVLPVCLGFLLRLLLSNPAPRLIALLGAALILAVPYMAGDRAAGSQFDVSARNDITLPMALAVHTLGILFSMLLAFLFVNGGVKLADRWRAVRACHTSMTPSP